MLADIVAETALPDYSFGDFWAHQIRWARNMRDRRPVQYVGLMLTFGLVWAVVAVFEPIEFVDVADVWSSRSDEHDRGDSVGRDVLRSTLLRDLWLVPFGTS